MINLELDDAKKIMDQFTCQVNSLSFKARKMAGEYKDAELMKDLDLCWIQVLADPDYCTDLRNEASAETGRQLACIPFISEKLKHPSSPKMEAVARKMAREHRSIQQLFSELVFCHLALTCTTEELDILTDSLGEDFYMLPFI